MPRSSRRTPREIAGDTWPHEPLDDVRAEPTRLFVVALRNGINGRSMRGVAALAGVNRITVANVLAGTSWPDTATVAALEHALEQPLWPTRRLGSFESAPDAYKQAVGEAND